MYGIGCSAFYKEGIEKINSLKQRKPGKGFIVLIPEISWLQRYGIVYDKKTLRLCEQFWPGNLSIILNDPQDNFSLISSHQKVAFRIPADSYLRNLISQFDEPIVSTSINKSGEKPETDITKIKENYLGWFDHFYLNKKAISDSESVPSTIIDTSGNDLLCLRSGSVNFKIIRRAYDSPLILFVCTGNICRSPIAEYLLRDRLKKNDLNYRVTSAGFLNEGVRISSNSHQVLKEQGINSISHYSKKINAYLLMECWRILTMEEKHKAAIISDYPETATRVFTFSEFCGREFCSPGCDIDDPYNLDIYFYRETFMKIRARIEALIEKLKFYKIN